MKAALAGLPSLAREWLTIFRRRQCSMLVRGIRLTAPRHAGRSDLTKARKSVVDSSQSGAANSGTLFSCRHKIRTDIPAVGIYKIHLTALLPPAAGLPSHLETIGDHIRNKRIQSSYEQGQLAKLLGVTTSTIWNWENRRSEPRVCDYMKIIDFLGYNPLPHPSTFAEELISYRRLRGLRIRDAAALAKVDPASWSSWEREEHKITDACRIRIQLLLQSASHS